MLFAILLGACSPPQQATLSTVFRDSAGVRIVENAGTSAECVLESTPDLDLGLVEGPAEYQFHSIGDAGTLSDGRVAVVDQGSGKVRVFFPHGGFDLAFGGEGEGPEEFRAISQLWTLPGDTMLVSDQRPLRFSRFTASGDFVRSVVIEPIYANPPQAIGLLAGSTYLVAGACCPVVGAPWEWAERRLTVLRHSGAGSLIDTLGTLPFGRQALFDEELFIAGSPVFEARSRVFGVDRQVAIGRGDEREIEIYDVAEMGRPTALVRWTGPDRTVRAEDVAAFRAWELGQPARVGLEDNEWYRRASEVLASTDRLVADRFPAHGDVRISRNGTLWIHEYPQNRDRRQEWLAFGPTGEFQCRLRVPFRQPWDLYEFGPDYVMGNEADEVGVEHVRRYRFAMPSLAARRRGEQQRVILQPVG